MTNVFHTLIARFLQIPEGQVERTIGLLNEGATIPFISRYRKEVTGGLDEVQIGAIKDQLDKLTELSKRKETILATIEEQGKLTPELRKRIEESWDHRDRGFISPLQTETGHQGGDRTPERTGPLG